MVSGKGAKDKGSRAEREVVALYDLHLGIVPRRTLAGHREDHGDLSGIPHTTCQIKDYSDPLRAIREGLPELIEQQANARTAHGVLWVRRRGGAWICVQSPEQHFALWREAVGA